MILFHKPAFIFIHKGENKRGCDYADNTAGIDILEKMSSKVNAGIAHCKDKDEKYKSQFIVTGREYQR